MAIKISGNTIIDDSRVVTNAERVGIGITPRYDLEVLSDTTPTGIAASVTNTQSNDVNKGLLVFNKNVADPTFTVSYRGRVDALEYYGVFKGSIDPGVAIDKADKINIQTNSSNASQYLTFVDSTSGYEDVKVHTGIRYNPNFYGNGGSSRLSIDGDVGIAGTLTYEDVTNVDSIGLVTARTGVRITTGGLIVNAGISSFGAHIYPLANETHNIGESDSNRFNAVYAKEFRGGTFYGTIDGGVSLVADTVKTVKRSTNANHYLTFVDSNNNSATAESMYTDGDITYNPSTNELVVPKIKPAGIINASGGSGTANYVIQADGSGGWDWGLVEPGNIGTLNFTDLDDTPANYTSAGGKLVRVNSGATGLEFITASDAGKTYTLEGVDSGDNAILRLSDGTNNDDVLITAGSNITINPVAAGGFTIAAEDGAGLGVAASAADILSVTGGQIAGDSAGADKIVFWDNSGTKLTYLTVGNGLDITGTEITATSAAGKTYTLEGVDSGDNAILRLSDGSLDDDVLITAGTGITLDSVSAGGFTINATGGGSLSDIDVKQFSNHTTTPKTERTCPNPIEVNISGIGATIGIGSTSNAYGRRYIQDTAPSTGVCEGDIWFDTSSPSLGSDRVAILRDEKTSGTYGGRPGEGDYVGYRAYDNGVDKVPNSWFPRIINMEYDPSDFVSVGIGSTTTFALESGSYKINWRVPGFHCDSFQSRIAYNANSDFSGTTTYYYGSSQYSGNYPTPGNWSDSADESEGEFVTTISATTYFKIEQWIGNAPAAGSPDYGFQYATLGVAIGRSGLTGDNNAVISGIGNSEVYTQIRIEDLATAVKEGSGFVDKIEEGNTKAEVVDTGSDGHFLVETEGTERLRIGPGGNVGIGTNVPATFGSNTTVLQTYNPSSYSANLVRSGTRELQMIVSEFNGSASVGTRSNHDVNICANDDSKVIITTNGNVGIGTRIPTDPVLSTNTAKLAVGIVTAFKYYGDGSNLTGVSGGAGSAIILLAEKTATGETSVEFTGIPSDAMEITLMFKGISASGTNNFKIQLGTSSGYITSGYDSLAQNEGGGDEFSATDCFIIGSTSAGHVRTGSMLIKKASGTSYVQTGQFAVSPSTSQGGNQTYGSLSSVSGTVDRLKIILSGSNTFDAGTMNVSYKTTGGGSTSGHTRVAVVKDQKNYNVLAGTFLQGAWRDRDLTVKDDPFGFVTLYPTTNGQTNGSPGNDPGYFSLPAGKYKIRFRAPAYRLKQHKAAMLWSSTESNISKTYATTDSRDGEAFGSSEYSGSVDGRVGNASVGVFTVEITQTSYFKVIHYGKDSSDTSGYNGFGVRSSIGTTDPEIYTIVEIEDLATATKSGVTIGDKIEEGDTSAEVIDTGSDGHFIVKAEGKEKFRVNGSTNNVFIGGHTSDNPFTYLRFAGSQYGAADIRPMDELSHKVGLSFYVDNTQDTTINPVERMHLTHNGILNIGRAVGGASSDPINATGDVTAGIKLLGATSSSTPGDGFAIIANAKTIVGIFNRTNTTGRILEFKYNASVVGRVETDGTNTSYIESSDYRLKENIVGISDGITRLKTLKPYRFNFKSYPERTVDGFLAHEVTTAVPEAISGTKDQVDSDNNPVYQGIDKSKLVPLLVAALQEAVARIETLETEVAALKG